MSLLALGILGALFGFGSSEVRRFESAAAAEIRGKLRGDAAVVRVRMRAAGLGIASGHLASATIEARDFATDGLPLFTEPERTTRGRVDELRIRLRDFTLSGLRVERLEATIPACRYDLGLAMRRRQIRLSRSGVGTGTVVVRQDDLADFLVRKFRELKRVELRLQNGRARVVGEGDFLLVRAAFEVDARLESPDGVRLFLADARILLDGKEAEPAARDALLATLNPVVDLDRDLGLAGAVRVERLDLRDGRLTAWGATRIPLLPAVQQRVRTVSEGLARAIAANP